MNENINLNQFIKNLNLKKIFKELYPICRSITGKGFEQSLDILNSVSKNAKWQRVFGDWFQANWSTKKQYAEPLYLDIAKTFEKVIENSLQDRSKLTTTLAFEDKSYFYATPKSLFFVPSVNDLDDISIKNLKYGAPDGTSQKYLAEIGMPGSIENAAIIIYIRYANGMFETNPTVRIQSLRNPEFIGWQKLV